MWTWHVESQQPFCDHEVASIRLKAHILRLAEQKRKKTMPSSCPRPMSLLTSSYVRKITYLWTLVEVSLIIYQTEYQLPWHFWIPCPWHLKSAWHPAGTCCLLFKTLCKRTWARAAVTKYHIFGGLNSINLFPYSFGDQHFKAEVWAGVFQWKLKVFFWDTSPWLADSHILTVSSHGLFLCGVCVLISSYHKDASYR